jgi:uncharacterized phiE125 gp8 family phage protein
MWLDTQTTIQPVQEPVGVEEARAQLEIETDDTTHDSKLSIYLKAARERVEVMTGTALIERTVVMRGCSFAGLALLPIAPIVSITAVAYLDSDDVEQTIDGSLYEPTLHGLRPAIRLKVGQSWPIPRGVGDAVRVTAVAGYGPSAEDVPDTLRLAILLLVGDWMAYREDSQDVLLRPLPTGVEKLVKEYRRYRGL